MKKQVTMSDIGKELNVSTVTVSKALGDKDGVSEELREKIKVKAAQMGYRYNNSAKMAREGRTHNIGIVVAKRYFAETSSFYWVMYKHLVEYLARKNYYALLEVVSDESESLCQEPKSITANKIDGLIVLGQMTDDYVKSIRKISKPTVLLDFYGSKSSVDCVLSDSFYGSYMITCHLLENGHTNIGFVGTISATSSIQDRYLGYYKALLEYNIDLRQDWIIDDRDEHNSFNEVVLPEDMPTAFVCNCDEAAYRLVNQLKEMDLDVPEDISVVGYDNYIYSTISRPQLTTVDVNSKKMAAEAVDIIVKKIKDPSYTIGRTLVTGNLIKRDSVKKLND